MADEIIKLFEYLSTNDQIRGFATAFSICFLLVTFASLFFIGFVFVKLFKSFKDM